MKEQVIIIISSLKSISTIDFCIGRCDRNQEIKLPPTELNVEVKVRGFIYFNSKIEKSEFYFPSLVFVDSDGRILQYKFTDTRKIDQSIFLIKPVPIGNDDLDNLIHVSEDGQHEEMIYRERKREIDIEKPKMQPMFINNNSTNGSSSLNIFAEPHRNNSLSNSNSIFDVSNQPIKTIWTDPSLNNANFIQIKNEGKPDNAFFNQTNSLNLNMFPKEPENRNMNLNSNTGFLLSSSQTALPANNMFMTNKNISMNTNKNSPTPTLNLFDKSKQDNSSFLFSNQNNFNNPPKIDFEIKRNNNITIQRLQDSEKSNASMNRNNNLDIFSNKNQLNPDPPKFIQGNNTISPINANNFSPQNNLSSSFKISPISNSPFENKNAFSSQSFQVPSFQNISNINQQNLNVFNNNNNNNNVNRNDNMGINISLNNKDDNFLLSNGISAGSQNNQNLMKTQFNLSNASNNQLAFNQSPSAPNSQKNVYLNSVSNQNFTFNPIPNRNPPINNNNNVKNSEISFFANKPGPNFLTANNNNNNNASFDLNSTNQNSLNISSSSEKQAFYFNKHLSNIKKQEVDLKSYQKEFNNFLKANIIKIKNKLEDYLESSSQQINLINVDSNDLKNTRGFILLNNLKKLI